MIKISTFKHLIGIPFIALLISPFLVMGQVNEYHLVWQDEFNYTGLPDSLKWSYDTIGNDWGWGNNELQWYTSHEPTNSYVDNGTLKIVAKKEQTNGKAYSSARLVTKGKGDWIYGKIEVRAKLPEGNGTWPAIWMLHSSSEKGWPKGGEIDIMEHVGYAPDSVFSTVHTGSYNHIRGTQVGNKVSCATLTSQFHTFTLEWTPQVIKSYLDGNLYFIFTNEHKSEAEWPFNQPFHLILNLAVGGNLGGKMGIDDQKFPHTYEIDYVRVFQKK